MWAEFYTLLYAKWLIIINSLNSNTSSMYGFNWWKGFDEVNSIQRHILVSIVWYFWVCTLISSSQLSASAILKKTKQNTFQPLSFNHMHVYITQSERVLIVLTWAAHQSA